MAVKRRDGATVIGRCNADGDGAMGRWQREDVELLMTSCC